MDGSYGEGAETPLARQLRHRKMSVDGFRKRLEESTDGLLSPDRSLVWRWIHGRVRPSKKYMVAIARALDLDSEALGQEFSSYYIARQTVRSTSSEVARIDSSEDHAQRTARTDDLARLKGAHDMFSRRRLLGAALIAAAATPAGRLYGSLKEHKLSPAALEGLSVMTEHFGRNFDRYDYRELDLQIASQLEFVGRYLDGSLTVRQRTELCASGARLSALAGFVAFLTGRLDRAIVCYENAFTMAEEVQDLPLMAWVVAEEASMACYAGQAKLASGMTSRAPATRNSPNQLANISSNAARAFSSMGRRTEAIDAIRNTERWSALITPESDSSLMGPMWSFSQISAFTRIGESWLNLGEPGQASASALQAIDHIAAKDSPRFTAHARLVLASAYAKLDDAERACSIASSVFELFPQDFHTVASRAATLFDVLPPATESRAVLDLREEFAFYLEASTNADLKRSLSGSNESPTDI